MARDCWLLGNWRRQMCHCQCSRNASWLPREVVGTEGSLQPVHKTRSALKRWSTKCVSWTSSSIVRNADFQAHLTPAESRTLEGRPSVSRFFSQRLATPTTAEVWEPLCYSSRGVGGITLLSLQVTSSSCLLWHPPLFILCVILVFMNMHFSCQLILKTSSSEDTVIYFSTRENLAGSTLLRGGYVHLQWAPCWVIVWLWPIFTPLWTLKLRCSSTGPTLHLTALPSNQASLALVAQCTLSPSLKIHLSPTNPPYSARWPAT